MCGRFVLQASVEAVAAYFRVSITGLYQPRFNIAPTQPVLTIAQSGEDLVVEYARWGLVPSWHKDPANAQLLINARSETVLEKPSFRAAIRHRRVLVPATHFYEWQREGAHKQPYAVDRKVPDGPEGLFAMAGIVEETNVGDGSTINTLAMLTQEADGAVATIHHRMPMVVPPGHYDSWLNCRTVEAAEALEPLRTPLHDAWKLWPVARVVNRAGVEGPELLEEVVPETPAPPPPNPQMDLF